MKGIFFLIALLGVLINIFAVKITQTLFKSEEKLLQVKVVALILVIIGVTLLMIFGK